MSKLNAKEKQIEQEINALADVLSQRGLKVRREQLVRGRSYRVKSGECMYSGESVIFIDKRLPLEQQLSVLKEYS
jgi:CRISPR/Cas system Type II protein with McrA/HNH and RuvC-like nuclease domain